MVLRLAVTAEALATGAVEHQRGGIEQHDGEIAEQAAPAFEQSFFDQVLGASGRARSGLDHRFQPHANQNERQAKAV